MVTINEPNSYVIKLVALFDVGRFQERKRGLAQTVASMLKKNTRTKSNTKLQEELDRYGIGLEIYSSPLFFTAELHCHIQFVEKSIPLFFEVLFDAHFTEKSWSVVKNQSIETILQQENQTDFWADKLLSEYIFGSEHPLGYYSNPKDYQSINLADIREFYIQNIQNNLPTLFLAGDVNPHLEKIIQSQLSIYNLKKNNTELKINFPSNPPKIIEKRIQNSSQASIRLGKMIPRKGFDDFIALELYSTLMGGYYTSKLMKTLRIEKGFTYGVYSYLIHFPDYSFLQIAFETDAEYINSSLQAINELFGRLQNEDLIDFSEARMQYYSQWSKNAERSLQEVMYYIKLDKLGYQYPEYKNRVEDYASPLDISMYRWKESIFDFSTYSKSIVY